MESSELKDMCIAAIDAACVSRGHSSQYEGDYFNNYRWNELYDEQKQIAAQLDRKSVCRERV